MNTAHPYAAQLTLIAEGKPLEVLTLNGREWVPVEPGRALRLIAGGMYVPESFRAAVTEVA